MKVNSIEESVKIENNVKAKVKVRSKNEGKGKK